MADQSSAELSGWIAYERLEEEKQVEMLTYAIEKAFSKPKAKAADDDDEEIIDTTKPEFVEQFQGFTNTPQGKPQRNIPTRGTQILKG